MYPCLLLKVLAEYELQLCACSEKRLLCACVPVRLAKGYTPRLHLGGEGAATRRRGTIYAEAVFWARAINCGVYAEVMRKWLSYAAGGVLRSDVRHKN